MDALDVSRWQFGITTVYHFIFVPLTIGLAPLIAVMQTVWVVTGNTEWYRLTRFFGKLFLINFAIGVATGIVQEFQFGMNWSEYSRFVGDIFGAPLAMEGLVAFFFESTFIGLWIFGWTRLPRLVHLACIWIVAIAVNMSAFFIISANSFMQHPVGAAFNPETGRAELHSIVELFTNNTAICGLLARGGGRLPDRGHVRGRRVRVVDGAGEPEERTAPATAADAGTCTVPPPSSGCWVALAAALGLFLTGDMQGKLMFQQQPMKMASAESLCHTETDPALLHPHRGHAQQLRQRHPPHRGALRAAVPRRGQVHRRDPGWRRRPAEEGRGEVRPRRLPPEPVRHLLVVPRDDRLPGVPGPVRAGRAVADPAAAACPTRSGSRASRWSPCPRPFLANSAGWVFTEMGRQPWVVVPNPTGDQLVRLTVQDGVSHHSAAIVWISLIVFTLTYAVAGGHLVLPDAALRRRRPTGARLRTRAAHTARRRRRRAIVVRLLRS